jgi:hypothetical protein
VSFFFQNPVGGVFFAFFAHPPIFLFTFFIHLANNLFGVARLWLLREK